MAALLTLTYPVSRPWQAGSTEPVTAQFDDVHTRRTMSLAATGVTVERERQGVRVVLTTPGSKRATIYLSITDAARLALMLDAAKDNEEPDNVHRNTWLEVSGTHGS